MVFLYNKNYRNIVGVYLTSIRICCFAIKVL